jgi:hypothetical protein
VASAATVLAGAFCAQAKLSGVARNVAPISAAMAIERTNGAGAAIGRVKYDMVHPFTILDKKHCRRIAAGERLSDINKCDYQHCCQLSENTHGEILRRCVEIYFLTRKKQTL